MYSNRTATDVTIISISYQTSVTKIRVSLTKVVKQDYMSNGKANIYQFFVSCPLPMSVFAAASVFIMDFIFLNN